MTLDLYLVKYQCPNECNGLLLPTGINLHSQLLTISILSIELVGALITMERVEITILVPLDLSLFFFFIFGSVFPVRNLKIALSSCVF